MPNVPRVVLNKDAVDNFDRPNDIYIPGDCDESIWSLCQKLGWEKELWKLHNEIGGVGGDWELRGAESSIATTGETQVDTSVEQLTKELERELKLDKEEDIKLKNVEDIVDKPGDKSEPWDDDAVVQSKKDAHIGKETEETEVKDSEKPLSKAPKENL